MTASMRQRWSMVDVTPIRSTQDYEQALRAAAALWGAETGTPRGDQLDVLATLIDAYEAEHFPIEPPSAAAIARFATEEQAGIAASDELIFHLVSDAAGLFSFQLVAASGEVIVTSETFDSKSAALKAIRLLQTGASGSRIIDMAA